MIKCKRCEQYPCRCNRRALHRFKKDILSETDVKFLESIEKPFYCPEKSTICTICNYGLSNRCTFFREIESRAYKQKLLFSSGSITTTITKNSNISPEPTRLSDFNE